MGGCSPLWASDALGGRLMKGQINLCVCMFVCACTHMHVCAGVYARECVSVYMCMCMCVCAQVCMVKTSKPLCLHGVRLLQAPSWPERPGKCCLINIESCRCPRHPLPPAHAAGDCFLGMNSESCGNYPWKCSFKSESRLNNE